jgi:hypothetical protein
MRRLWKIIGLCFVLGFCLVPVGICGVVSYWFIAQDLADQAMHENYKKVELGMTLNQVEEILGPAMEDISDPFRHGDLTWIAYQGLVKRAFRSS